MPLTRKSGLVLIPFEQGFDVYGSGAGPQLGFIEPFGPPGGSKLAWLAYDAQNHLMVDARRKSRYFRSRDAAAESLFEQKQTHP
jgi:hypothetical protein